MKGELQNTLIQKLNDSLVADTRTQLILLDPLPPGTAVPNTVELTPAIPWFLEAPES